MHRLVHDSLLVFTGLAIGAFLAELFTDRDWGRVAERLFFQFMALVTLCVARLLSW